MARIYVASSWRNGYQPTMVRDLRAAGHEVYDFRNPPFKSGFSWRQMDPEWEGNARVQPEEYRDKIQRNMVASHGFLADYRAMQWADTGLLVLPCGRSAHIEAGYFNGASKRLIIYVTEPAEPELMYLMANHICVSTAEVLDCLKA